MSLKDKTVLVIDNGLFFHFADVLSREFGKVLYWTPWQKAYPKKVDQMLGVGFENVHRIVDRFEYYDEADVLVYPDVGYGAEQVYWRGKGKPVWGAGYGEALELERVRTKKLLAKLGQPVGPYTVINGVSSLREHLEKCKNVWVKMSAMRGDAETFKSERYELIKPVLDDLEARLGPMADRQEFVVEETIDSELEIGCDTFCIDGIFPKTGIVGIEIKDAGYIGSIQNYEKLSPILRSSNIALFETFKKNEFRGLYSSEVRLGKDKRAYLIDPCCRAGSPPSEVYVEMYSNWGEIVWAGAHGEIVEPIMVAKYGAELMVETSWAEHHWLSVKVEDSVRRFVKLKNPFQQDGNLYVVPTDAKITLCGAVVGLGDSPKAAIEACVKNKGKISAYGLHSEDDAFDDALEKIEVARRVGISF